MLAVCVRLLMEHKEVILEIKNLVKHYKLKKGLKFFHPQEVVHAVDGVSFPVYKGETLGLVGESGCGKSTLGRSILLLDEPNSGEVVYKGNDMLKMKPEAVRRIRKDYQIIFQDPYASLNPRMKVRNIVAEPLLIHKTIPKRDIDDYVANLLETVGLNRSYINRYPHEFSGGQRQRIGIARAIACEPSIVICDEPISALDVSIQAQVLNLLMELQKKFQLTYLMISHDLSMVRYVSDRMIVMYLGVIVEMGESDAVTNDPYHPYTEALLSAVPKPNPKIERERQRILLKGDVPSPIKIPSGCRFHTRCHKAMPKCSEQMPEMKEISPGHYAACLLY